MCLAVLRQEYVLSHTQSHAMQVHLPSGTSLCYVFHGVSQQHVGPSGVGQPFCSRHPRTRPFVNKALAVNSHWSVLDSSGSLCGWQHVNGMRTNNEWVGRLGMQPPSTLTNMHLFAFTTATSSLHPQPTFSTRPATVLPPSYSSSITAITKKQARAFGLVHGLASRHLGVKSS